ncbi:hypothetical protein F2P79_000570 [Pimephales promelas]|nr:hypothetical protein F2P79_000570 [Pimephales promelas]
MYNFRRIGREVAGQGALSTQIAADSGPDPAAIPSVGGIVVVLARPGAVGTNARTVIWIFGLQAPCKEFITVQYFLHPWLREPRINRDAFVNRDK